jgi:hypothetical protein
MRSDGLPSIVSYADRFSVRPGETLGVMVSADVGPIRQVG